MLEPVFVRLEWGRVGSVLLMQLLATSPEISFDRVYPFENLCLANLLYYLEPLEHPVDVPAPGAWIDDGPIWWASPEHFGFRISGAALGYDNLGVDRRALHLRTVRSAWEAYSDLAPWPGESRPRFYAEKYGGGAEILSAAGIGYRFIDVVRDPRDVWCSVLAFDSKRGFHGFGRREDWSEEQYLSVFLAAIKRRLDAMATTDGTVPAIVVRYEDVVADMDRTASRLGEWLGVKLDPETAVRASEDYRRHRTTSDANDSVERWRDELTPGVKERFVEELGDHLDRHGYPRG